MKVTPILDLTLTTSGTVNVPSEMFQAAGSFDGNVARVSGTQTLVGNFAVSPTGTPVKNTDLTVLWEAVCTPSGNSVDIFGATIPDELLLTVFMVRCVYSGTKWNVTVIPSWDVAAIVSTARIAAGAVTATELATGAVTTAKIAAGAVTTTEIGALAVTTAKIANGAVTATQLGALSVTTAKINTKSVTTTELGDLAVTTAKIAAGAVTATELGALAVTTAKINTGAVTTAELGALAVTTAKIAAGAVTTTELGAAAVTPTKMSANANTYTRDILIAFDDAAQVGVVKFIINEDCSIPLVSGTVMHPFLNDTGTIIFKNNAGTVMTGSQMDFTTALVLGNQITNTVTANNVFTAGQSITMELSKTTKTSGIANISLKIVKS